MEQILKNLLSNAIKFTEKGEIELAVHLEDYDATQGQGYFCFSVRDTGIGIEPAMQAKIFDRFVQASEAVARRYGGTGLGLAISRQLVEMMGGEIGVRSQQGKGSCFWFRMPLPGAHQQFEHPLPRLPPMLNQV